MAFPVLPGKTEAEIRVIAERFKAEPMSAHESAGFARKRRQVTVKLVVLFPVPPAVLTVMRGCPLGRPIGISSRQETQTPFRTPGGLGLGGLSARSPRTRCPRFVRVTDVPMPRTPGLLS